MSLWVVLNDCETQFEYKGEGRNLCSVFNYAAYCNRLINCQLFTYSTSL